MKNQISKSKLHLAGLLLAAAMGTLKAEVPVDFVRDVAPILTAHCTECHGPNVQKDKVSLQRRAHAMGAEGWRKIIEPGRPDRSRLLAMVAGPEAEMPKNAPRLSEAEVGILRRWIAEGALWPKDLVLKEKVQDGGDWWSLQPVKAVSVPRGGEIHPVDAFLRVRLAEQGLDFSPPADRRTLIRRLSFDLLGLPPSPEEVVGFEADSRPDAYERLVDRYLASPRYGERWARHWLDIAHYADTHGFERDQKRKHAWPYRDYVIQAFNRDLPYDRFIKEQLAGDVLAPEDRDAVIATGFLAAGPWDKVGHDETPSPVLKRGARADDLDDMVTQVITATMGLTINCARCHNHKLDPIPQSDYYRLWAVFAGTQRGERPLPAGGKLYGPVAKTPAPVQVLVRGNTESPAEPVTPGGLSCSGHAVPDFGNDATPEGERRRLLAEWIVHPANPLTARVMVNRLWHHHFGRGIVDTPSDFGRGGGAPSHPELLDWLAGELQRCRWSLKHLHRLLVTSRAYQQQSGTVHGASVDASNRLLWRMNPRRLDAESLRDAVLTASGCLNAAMGGPGYQDFTYQEAYAPIYQHVTADRPGLWRRSIYRFIVRTTPQRFLSTMDCPDPANLTPARLTTTTALQALSLLNNEFMLQQAGNLARRIEQSPGASRESQIQRAFALVLQRAPDAVELGLARTVVDQQGLPQLCRLLLNANEFVLVD